MKQINTNIKKIIHVDMDAFFVSVEERENPALKGRFVAVGGSPDKRGVIATANYMARKKGVHSAMSSSKAKILCPQLVLLPTNFALYREISNQVREIFYQITDRVEIVSIDEAYLDVSNVMMCQGSATRIAKLIQEMIFDKTKLTASVGVSYNKFLAKMASGINKPAGIFVILPNDAKIFINNLPIKDFHGVGPVTTKKLNNMGIYYGKDIKKYSLPSITKKLGKFAGFLYRLADGIDNREVSSTRNRLSFGSEITFNEDISNKDEILKELDKQAQRAYSLLLRENYLAKTITIKIKYYNFKQNNKSYTHKEIISLNLTSIIIKNLYEKIDNKKPVRLVGVSFSGVISEKKYKKSYQLKLFN